MEIAVFGSGGTLARRERVARARTSLDRVTHWGDVTVDNVAAADKRVVEASGAADVLLLGVTAAVQLSLAATAVRHGLNVLFDQPIGSGQSECRTLVDLAHEAGVVVGVSRPTLHLAPVQSLLAGKRFDLVLVHGSENPIRLQSAADLLDLAGRLTGSRDIQRLDGQSAKSGDGGLDSLAISARFQSGGMALIHLGRGDAVVHVKAAGTARSTTEEIRVGLRDTADAVEAETLGFLDACEAGTAPPFSLRDAVQNMRYADQLAQRLRGRAVLTT